MGCKVEDEKCRVWSASVERGVQSVECRVKSVKYGV